MVEIPEHHPRDSQFYSLSLKSRLSSLVKLIVFIITSSCFLSYLLDSKLYKWGSWSTYFTSVFLAASIVSGYSWRCIFWINEESALFTGHIFPWTMKKYIKKQLADNDLNFLFCFRKANKNKNFMSSHRKVFRK